MWTAVGIIGSVAVFCLIFRPQIIELFPRLKSLGIASFRQKDQKLERDLKAEAEALLRELDSELLREQESMVRGALEKTCGTGIEAVPVLMRYLTAIATAYRILEDYMRIYGSQLSLLEYLNESSRVVAGEPPEAMRVFYQVAAVQYPSIYKGDTFERWLGHLKDRVLVREDGGRLRVTVYGREFLAHIVKMGWSKDKVG